jgi:hypothetical protein
MKPTVFDVLTPTAVLACHEPTRPTDSSSITTVTATPAAASFTVRNLGSLSGNQSNGLSINERSEVAGVATLAS